MNSPNRCPKCNAPLAPTAGDPICPACLMRGALEPTESELVESWLTETRPVEQAEPWSSLRSVGASTALIELNPGSDFGDYRIVRRLGRGGMGIVYEAEHLPSSRRVALKVLAQSLDQPQARARFLREGRLAASINHPNSVYVFGTEEIDGVPTISMELVDGGTLAQSVKTKGPMSVRAAVDAVLQIIDGLAAADARGVLHRDVKPSNCFVASDGTVKVGDFGLSISTQGSQPHSLTDVTTEGTFLGTPAFASPEQLRGEPLDRRSDIYSVGVTLFYLLTGEVPFDSENMVQLLATVLDKPAPSAASIRDDIPSDLDSIVLKCLQKPAGNRYDSYESLRYALKPFSSESPIGASLGNRLLAGVVDVMICWLVLSPISFLAQYQSIVAADLGTTSTLRSIVFAMSFVAATVAYYAICEWRYGYTIGKRLLGLRVASGENRPRFGASLSRALLFVGLPSLPSISLNLLLLPRDSTEPVFGLTLVVSIAAGWSYYLLKYGLFVTARASNGYLAIHDRLTGTRVLERPAELGNPESSTIQDAFEVEPNTKTIGPYHQLQTLFDRGAEQLVLAYDTKLLRRVWLHLQPIGTPSVAVAIRQSGSRTNLRWLGGRRSETECWDCYEAPSGSAFADRRRSLDGSHCIRLMRKLVKLIDETEGSIQTNLIRSGDQNIDDSALGRITLERLWVTDLDDIKILPFELTQMDPRDDASSEAKSTGLNRSTDLIRRAATCCLGSKAASANDYQTWSLSQYQAIRRLGTTTSILESHQILDGLDPDRAVHLPQRILAMQASSMLAPLAAVALALFTWFLYNQQRHQYPEIDQLHEVAQVLQREESLLTAERLDRVIAVQRYVAGNFRELLNNANALNSIYAVVQITPGDRISLRKALDAQHPTPEELAAATLQYATLRQDWIDAPVDRPTLKFSYWATLSPAYGWLEFVWMPSLITGLFFRGGLLMRIFGLVLVNRRGQRVSGLRVFLRMLIGGLPVIAIVFTSTALVTDRNAFFYWSETPWSLLTALLLIAVAATMLIVPYHRGNQCMSDRFANTYFMVK